VKQVKFQKQTLIIEKKISLTL